MEVNEALNIVQSQLTKERFAHTERVVEQAQILVDQNGVDQKKAAVAAALHDYAKERPLRELRYWITHSTLPKDLLTFHHELWHGPVGAQLISSEHGVTRSEEHTSELQSRGHLVCRLLLEKKNYRVL